MLIVVQGKKGAWPMIRTTFKTAVLKEERIATAGNTTSAGTAVFVSAAGRVSVRIRGHPKKADLS